MNIQDRQRTAGKRCGSPAVPQQSAPMVVGRRPLPILSEGTIEADDQLLLPFMSEQLWLPIVVEAH